MTDFIPYIGAEHCWFVTVKCCENGSPETKDIAKIKVAQF